MQALDGRIRSIANMFSIGVGIGMGETDFVAVSEALNWAKHDSSVVYISVTGNHGEEIALFDPKETPLPADYKNAFAAEFTKDEAGHAVFFKGPIIYENQLFGSLIIGYSLKNIEANIRQIENTTLLFCLGLLAAGTIFSVVMGRMISLNITKLYRAVQAISQGAQNVRVAIKSDDEIGKLALSFNAMLDKIEKSQKELINSSNKLKKQNDELNQFSYVVSHDLKAPLRAIFKLSEWIEEDLGPFVAGDSKKNLQILRGRVFRMESLINGLLEYARVGKVNIASERTDVGAVIRDVLDLLNPPPRFTITVDNNMPVFATKKVLMQQVFLNLLSNAIKYNNKEAARIKVSVLRSGSFFQFCVTDNGIGIDAAFHEKIFTIFQTLEARDQVEATGVGLSITKRIIEEVGGSIRVESQPGIGSSFVFTWPTNT